MSSGPATNSAVPEAFGQYVRRLRESRGMKQAVLAEKAKITQSYVSGIERGINVQVDPEIVNAIADALETDRTEAMRVAAQSVGYVPELTRVTNLEDFGIPESYNELDDMHRSEANEEIAEAVDRVLRRQQRRRSGGN